MFAIWLSVWFWFVFEFVQFATEQRAKQNSTVDDASHITRNVSERNRRVMAQQRMELWRTMQKTKMKNGRHTRMKKKKKNANRIPKTMNKAIISKMCLMVSIHIICSVLLGVLCAYFMPCLFTCTCNQIKHAALSVRRIAYIHCDVLSISDNGINKNNNTNNKTNAEQQNERAHKLWTNTSHGVHITTMFGCSFGSRLASRSLFSGMCVYARAHLSSAILVMV